MAEKEIPLSGINSIAAGLLMGFDLLLKGCPAEVLSSGEEFSWQVKD
ncbi:MAG: hypothetical protein IPL04_17275 [Chitinophagaceae bacterium]|nr:hypothetical protein [Chitinophagaceae bacterium]